jgi:SAM-dependent methyltransferase
MTCVLCGSHEYVALPRATAMINSSFPGGRVVRCRGCGFARLHPVPDQPPDVYEEDYFEAYRERGIVFPTEATPHPRHVARLAFAERQGGPGRLLEIGIGHGGFMQLAAGRGWDTTGVEISRYAAAHVQERYGLRVIRGSIESAELPERAFDLVHMSHVLEHLIDPVAALVRVRSLLSSRGVLAIEVPNELANLYVALRGRFGSPPPYAVPSTHVSFFTPPTLRRTLERSGFRVVRLSTMRDLTDPRWVRRAAKTLVGAVERRLDRGPLIEAFAVPTAAGPVE